ncbi:hypothetical protein RRSWK_03452 [Rhodopirellula sp. SWK7]|nr:hypothetical protein RRSWK_03452 [Rhodopirellula sp. SWK7]
MAGDLLGYALLGYAGGVSDSSRQSSEANTAGSMEQKTHSPQEVVAPPTRIAASPFWVERI